MNQNIKDLQNRGYSPIAIAMHVGGPVGSKEYHEVLKILDPSYGEGCPNCGKPCFGTGDCNCMDD